MSIDLERKEVSVTPAVAEKAFPLDYMTLIRIDLSPESLSVYSEFTPYRRILAEDGVTVIGEELKSPVSTPDITVIQKTYSGADMQKTPEQEAHAAQTIGRFMAEGGDLFALVWAGMLLCVKQEGIVQGKFAAPATPPPVEDPVEPEPLL